MPCTYSSLACSGRIRAENPAKLQFCMVVSARSASILQKCSILAVHPRIWPAMGKIDVVLQQFPLFGAGSGENPARVQDFLISSPELALSRWGVFRFCGVRP